MNSQKLKTELFEKGIDLEIDQEENRVVLQLSERATNNIIGVAAGDDFEQALSTLIRRISDDSQRFKLAAIRDRDMLSEL